MVSVVVPAFNEEECLPQLLTRLESVIRENHELVFQVIIVDNGSRDATRSILESASRTRPWLTVVRLARNFDIEGAMLAGMDRATGDCLVFLNADLEDPPELISEFLVRWLDGAPQVVGVVKERTGYSALRRWLSVRYYNLASVLSGGAIQRNVSDFRLLDRAVYEELRSLREFERLNRGLIGWLGYGADEVEYIRQPRAGGKSSFKILPAALWGLRHTLSFTVRPLRMIALVGFALSLLASLFILALAVNAFVAGVPFAGFGSIIGVMLLVGGLQFLFIGVLAEYLAMIFLESKRRPRYVVDKFIEPRFRAEGSRHECS